MSLSEGETGGRQGGLSGQQGPEWDRQGDERVTRQGEGDHRAGWDILSRRRQGNVAGGQDKDSAARRVHSAEAGTARACCRQAGI